MAAGYTVQSVDLALTRYTGTASAAPLASADSWGSLDLQVVPRARTRTDVGQDLCVVAGRANLAQALTLRLLTRQGDLAALGHPGYGCKLVSLIGRNNTEITRNLARLHVLEAIRQEPRVRKLTALAVAVAPGQPDTIRISLTIEPLHDGDPLSLALDIVL